MLIDTHCHLEDKSFAEYINEVVQNARDLGVNRIVIPAVGIENFEKVQKLAHGFEGVFYALGIHPFFVENSSEQELITLESAIKRSLNDKKFLAVGEIGLDFYEDKYKNAASQQKQEQFFSEQIKLATKYNLPVILHIRKAHDRVLKILRQHGQTKGIAHAFNASPQQAQHFIDLGFKLGLGGAFTYTGSKRIRRLVKDLGLQHWVLETDAPFMPPAWLDKNEINHPHQVNKIAIEVAQFLNISLDEVAKITTANAKAAVFDRDFPSG